MFLGLGLEDFQDVPESSFDRLARSRWTKKIGLAEVAVIFRDFVFQNQFAAKGVPGEIGNQAMVLVPVVAIMSQDDVRREIAFSGFRNIP